MLDFITEVSQLGHRQVKELARDQITSNGRPELEPVFAQHNDKIMLFPKTFLMYYGMCVRAHVCTCVCKKKGACLKCNSLGFLSQARRSFSCFIAFNTGGKY